MAGRRRPAALGGDGGGWEMISKLMQGLMLIGVAGAAWAGGPTASVPEPATLGLIAAGAAAVGLLRRRR